MKIAVSSTGDQLESEMDERFGRCPFFIVVETDDMSYKAFANDNAELPSGAGIQAAGFLVDEGVRAVLTGNCGPKAAQVFEAAGVPVHTGYGGSVKSAAETFKKSGGARPSAASGAGPTRTTPKPVLTGPLRPAPDRTAPVRTGPGLTGQEQSGPYRPGPERSGPDRPGPVRTGSACSGPRRTGVARSGAVRSGPVRTGPDRPGSDRGRSGPGWSWPVLP